MYLHDNGLVSIHLLANLYIVSFLQSDSRLTNANGSSPTGKSPPSFVVSCPIMLNSKAGKQMTNSVILEEKNNVSKVSLVFMQTFFYIV